MTTSDRLAARQALGLVGFVRTSYNPARADGSYEEVWTHPDGSTAELHWKKDVEGPDMEAALVAAKWEYMGNGDWADPTSGQKYQKANAYYIMSRRANG